MPAELLPTEPWRDDSVACTLLVCALLLLANVLLRRVSFTARLIMFIFPHSTLHAKEVDHSPYAIIYALQGVMVSLLVGLVFLAYAHGCRPLHLIPLTSLQLIAVYAAVSWLVLTLKQALTVLVNAIFFPAPRRELWNKDCALLYDIESMLLLALTLATVFLDLSPQIIVVCLLALLLFVKILTLIKSNAHFFGNIYGTLHLFMYFCALEVVPLLSLWTMLDRLTNFMIKTL